MELESEKERINKKKSEEREMYLSLIKENEKRLELKKNQNELIKLINLKHVKEFDEMLEKQENERSNSNTKKRPVNEHLETKTQLAKNQDSEFKSFQENKYLKEKSEIENK